ncbi:MAG: alkaline phosphatase family protein [Candidatus Competibacteraceae bacterium]
MRTFADNLDLPLIIAGPIIRRLTTEHMVLWLVASQPLRATFELYQSDTRIGEQPVNEQDHCVRIGERAFIHLIDYHPDQALPTDCRLEYDLCVATEQGEQRLKDLLPQLLYDGETRPSLVLKTRLDNLLHGSCRKPHHPGADALARVDDVLAETVTDLPNRPAVLIMSGDQIYADDVAGPMLAAIHQTIAFLGLYPETLDGATVDDSAALYTSEFCYYQRENLLPKNDANRYLHERFFGGVRKPIFTTDSAHNHLITLAEVLAMYLLIWSPILWGHIRLSCDVVAERHHDLYRREQPVIERFVETLPQIQRALAHLPVYMIFDDHDVTDDWNLTRGWEESAYGHPFSRRIIGNALIGYWLCQAWGNAPQQFDDAFLTAVQRCFAEPGGAAQDALIDQLLEFEHWHYSVPTTPKIIVLNTRTQRWWSESGSGKPSGLMDWEALSELQQELLDEPSVVLVSAAPIFRVKLIEAVQRIFTFFGHALTVDAENWMVHPGSANVILNIFRHPKTPQHFVILSGDVHYSFMYDVKIRFRKNSPDIWQITCSGFKNEFPARLLSCFDLNRWLYANRSPLNWLTKRRHMSVRVRQPGRSFPAIGQHGAVGKVG